jgi:methyl-accepting chemotaxis protein
MDLQLPPGVRAIAEHGASDESQLAAWLDAQLAAAPGRPGSPTPRLRSPVLAAVLQRIESELLPHRNTLRSLVPELGALADCDLTQTPPSQAEPAGGDGREILVRLRSNLRTSMDQVLRLSRAIDDSADVLAHQNDELFRRTEGQGLALERASAAVHELAASSTDNAASAVRLGEVLAQSHDAAMSGLGIVDGVAASMRDLAQQIRAVEGVTDSISEIMSQTNILALNAAVEAARAGESGRSFAVIAGAIRELSARCGDSSAQIRRILQAAQAEMNTAESRSRQAVVQVQRSVETAQRGVAEMDDITRRATEQQQAIELVGEQMARLDAATQENLQLTRFLGQATSSLSDHAAFLSDAAGVFRLPASDVPLHERHLACAELAVLTAGRVSQAFTQAIDEGLVTLEALLDRRYWPIPGTDPQKFHTRYDQLADELLTPIQEAALAAHPFVAFVIAADAVGYVPTHNLKFAQKLTGDYKHDLAHNRTKRVFRDRVGRLGGQSLEPWTLQVYRRDTGELMFDVSAPVHVAGGHWGCVRVGYRL